MQMASKLHAILTRFREDRPTWRQVELARALEMSPSALSRSLAGLVETGFLRFRKVEGLEATGGYHWTRTPFEDDLGQVWIVDPEDPQKAPATTIPRERKEFRIRCVKEP